MWFIVVLEGADVICYRAEPSQHTDVGRTGKNVALSAEAILAQMKTQALLYVFAHEMKGFVAPMIEVVLLLVVQSKIPIRSCFLSVPTVANRIDRSVQFYKSCLDGRFRLCRHCSEYKMDEE